jgi:hypothetical protein
MNLGSRKRIKSGLWASDGVGGSERGRKKFVGVDNGADVRESEDMHSSTTTRRAGMSLHDGGWKSRGVLMIRLRPGAREEENAKELNGTLTSSSS